MKKIFLPSSFFSAPIIMRYAQIVLGPAGSGKSTYCSSIVEHCEVSKRSVHVINLDPAAEHFDYPVAWDIRDIISVDDVVQTLGFGPNGGLVYCMEFLLNNLEELEETLGNYEDDYLLFDCPGQIELYTHIPVMKNLVDFIQQKGYRAAAVYLLDSQFLDDPSKFFSGVLSALSTMVQLEIPHVNIMTKMDLVTDPDKKEELESFLNPDPRYILESLDRRTTPKQHLLNRAIASLIEEYSLVQFLPMDRTDEDSINVIMMTIDNCLQYGEDEDVRIPTDKDEDECPQEESDE